MANMTKKRLITLNERTDEIAERVKNRTSYGFSSWVRARLIAWDNKQKYGTEEDRATEILRLERKLSQRRRLAWHLAECLSDGDKAYVEMTPEQVLGYWMDKLEQAQDWQDVVE